MSRTLEDQKQRILTKKRELEQKEKLLKEKERKAQTKELVRNGSLIQKAGISALDPTALLGALLEISQNMADQNLVQMWTEKGSSFLEKKERKTKLILTFQSELTSEDKARLKKMKFTWHPFRDEWYGYSSKQEVLETLGKLNPKIEEVE